MCIQRKNSKIYIDQTVYLQKVLERFGQTNARFAATPLPAGYKPTENKDPADSSLRSKFQSVIGSLLYIMLGTRPDIAYAVTKMSQFAVNPSREHLDKALYICRYLAGTSNYALVYDGLSNKGLLAYTDSDWAADPIKRRSVTGYFFKLADGIISWQSPVICKRKRNGESASRRRGMLRRRLLEQNFLFRTANHSCQKY